MSIYTTKLYVEKALELLKLNQFRDKIKQDYCAKNNIPLLIIPYTELKTIDKILNKFIDQI